MNNASLNYLLEFSVIEPEKRQQYLDKLLSRKNAAGQKNVRLLKIIYRFVDTDKINDWDSAEVCKELNIKNGELDTLKSRLIADFRIFVFGWEKIEEKLKEGFSGHELEFDFLKARKMNNIGMKKEMKTFHLGFLNQLENDRKSVLKTFSINAAQLYLYEYESVETLAHYYYVQKNYPQFLEFYNKLEKLYKLKGKYPLTEIEEAIINVRLFVTRSYKNIYKIINDKNHNSALNNLYAAYELIKEYNLEVYRYGIPLLIALILFRLTENEKLKLLCIEIENKANREKREIEELVAKSYLAILEFNDNKSKVEEVKLKIKNYYERATEIAPYNAYTFILIKHYAHIISINNVRHEYQPLMHHALANGVLSHNKSFTMLTYYQIENEKYLEKILRFKNPESSMPEFIEPDDEVLEDFQKVLQSIIVSMKENISTNTISNIYITILYLIYIKSGNVDTAFAETIREKLKRMLKTRNIAIDYNLNAVVEFAFQAYEDFEIMKKSDFTDKYMFRLKSLCDKLKQSGKDNIYPLAEPYSILYTFAKRVNLSEAWEIMEKYSWQISSPGTIPQN